MRRKSLILSVLAAFTVALASCINDPSPEAFLVPEFGTVTVDESVPGSVEFNCRMSSMSQISEFGVYSSVGAQDSPQKTPGVLISQDAFKVRLDGLMGGANYTCRLFVSNGRVERLSEPISYAAPDNGSGRDPMVLRVRPASDGIAYLPLRGSLKCVVDWGDGTREACAGEYGSGTLAGGYLSHAYNAEATYVVSISGTVTALSSYALPDCSCICAVLDWGDTGLKDMGCAFQDQTGLEELAPPGGSTFSEVFSFRNAFSGSALKTLPAGFFDSCPASCDYSRAFASCARLESLPDPLFPAAESLKQCFKGCSALRNLPTHLCADPSSLRELQETFADCEALAGIPPTLLSGCSALERMVSVFSGCVSLGSLPASLFDDCRRLSVAEGVFMNCTSLARESPYTTVGGAKVHLYERSDFPELFTPIQKSYLCFFGCSGLSDYAAMPESWKRP